MISPFPRPLPDRGGAEHGPEEDRRANGPRRRVFLGGKVVHSAGAFSFDVQIRSLSEHGAKLVLPTGASAPDQFDLIHKRDGQLYQCAVAWRRGADLGVSFKGVQNLANPETSYQRAMKHLWLASLACQHVNAQTW